MKEGAGEDPFADETDTHSEGIDTSRERTSAETNSTREDSTSRRQMQIPYKYRRDGVQDGRDRVPLFLQEETKDAERDALREMEDRFGDSVSLTDLREALVLAGLDHLGDVETQLEEWGYGMTFED
jgi:hypothetical protein